MFTATEHYLSDRLLHMCGAAAELSEKIKVIFAQKFLIMELQSNKLHIVTPVFEEIHYSDTEKLR